METMYLKEDKTKAGLLSGFKFNLEMYEPLKGVLKSLGTGFLNEPEVPELLQWRAKISAFGKLTAATPTAYDNDVVVEDLYIDTNDGSGHKLRIRRYTPLFDGILPALYWMHGGGMMVGTPEQDEIQLKQIAVEAGAVVFSIEYRLAPEHPFPIPLDDVYTGLTWIADNAEELRINNNKIAIGGASAGAGLAASLALKATRTGGPSIVHQSLTYPMLDDRNFTNSSYEITSYGLWDRAYNLHGWRVYLKGAAGSEKVPQFSVPAREEDLSELPPAFIAVGALDLFRDEDIEFALRLMEAGVNTELHFYKGAVHGFDFHIPDDPLSLSFFAKRITALKEAFNHNI